MFLVNGKKYNGHLKIRQITPLKGDRLVTCPTTKVGSTMLSIGKQPVSRCITL